METARSLRNSSFLSALSRARRGCTLLACALGLAIAPSVDNGAARAASRRMIGQTIPICLTVTPQSNGSGGTNLATSVQVDQTGDYIQVGTDHPGIVNSPTGSWPFT